VPLDTCGNPLPAAAARPTTGATPSAPATGAAAAPALSPAEAATLRKPYTAEKPITGEGESAWGKAEGLQHVDPLKGSDASRAAAGATPGPAAKPDAVESIPAPASKEDPAASRPVGKEPTIAPPGIEVFPPAPASDTRDLPAAKTSGRPWLPPTVQDRGHTT